MMKKINPLGGHTKTKRAHQTTYPQTTTKQTLKVQKGSRQSTTIIKIFKVPFSETDSDEQGCRRKEQQNQLTVRN